MPPQANPLSTPGPLPKVLVFDLDYTLWPFWVDTHVSPPFKSSGAGATSATDRTGMSLAFYPDVPSIIVEARARGIKVAAASRTCAPDYARKLLKLLHIPVPSSDSTSASTKMKPAITLFDHLEIFPGNKTKHMAGISKALGVEYADMLFFDDEGRNRNVQRELGVEFVLVESGLNWGDVRRGIESWRRRRAGEVVSEDGEEYEDFGLPI